MMADWYSRAITGTRGNVLSNVANALMAFREDAFWKGRLSLNDFTAQELIDGKPITDNDIVDAQQWLQLAGMTGVSAVTAGNALIRVAADKRFHPIRDYFDNVEWDGIDRIGEWLTTYMSVEKTEYSMRIGRMMLIQMMARIYRPGCKADYTPILEGKGGIGKSTACKILAGGDEHFSDSLPSDLGSKDSMSHLEGKWIVELAELDAMNKNEHSTLKKFMTKTDDKFRPSYGRRDVIRKRQCSFIGTTNDDCYLRDPTGNRRYWPLRCEGDIDLSSLERDRDQLLAEALYYLNAGEQWHPDSEFEKATIAPEQELRMDYDVWNDTISDWLLGKSRVTNREVLTEALGMKIGDIKRADSNRVSDVLQGLGWTRSRSNGNRYWVRPGDQGDQCDQDSMVDRRLHLLESCNRLST